MKYPSFLNKGNSIYLCSPSFGCSTEPYKSRLNKAIEHFKNMDYKIIKGKYIYNQEGLLSSTPINLGKEINEAFSSDALLIMSVGGGEMMVNILDYIDFNNLQSKWFMGYSDNTNLTFLLNTICDIASIYGGCAPEFGSSELIDYQKDQIALFTGQKLKFKGYPLYEVESLKNEDNPYATLNLTMPSNIICYPTSKIHMRGRIIGGCLDVLQCLIGTKYDYVDKFNERYSDVIWFLEACELNIIDTARVLKQMKNAHWFKNAKGFIFGRPIITDNMFGFSMEELIIDTLSDLNVPIIMNADIGHVKPQIPVICGSIADIKTFNNEYEIEYILE